MCDYGYVIMLSTDSCAPEILYEASCVYCWTRKADDVCFDAGGVGYLQPM